MHFAAAAALRLPCTFVAYEPGQTHHDGRRYLPTVMLEMAADPPTGVLPLRRLPVVDRHHRVDLTQVGQAGSAVLVLLLCQFRLQQTPYRQGLLPQAGGIAGAPQVFGRVSDVATWEVPETPLPYQSLYCEYVLDIGWGQVGVRTHVTAPRLQDKIGCARLHPGDWVEVWRPRIDILQFCAK